ncbi:fumarylacetoacetate hydrolase family protein [Senegalia massiliensis]|uniref:FAA hydrolase family protein n=1 Tax=Senegalia massiliensis TaxID=1720316 RepID=A0A845QWT5_9CLOT|nr:fumarylacetoacetate hydrolase family protein [Senegalia massiliensis]NBI05976.1 FAA hydrolase family protein [Senegalia massiliensis]
MKIITFLYNNKEEIGIFTNEGVLNINEINLSKKFSDMIDFIKNSTKDDFEIIKESKPNINVDDIKLLSPIIRPVHDIICVGRNYIDHIKEISKTNQEIDVNNFKLNYFSKRANIIKSTKEDINGRFDLDSKIDYEVELAVIIGKKAKNIKRENIKEYIFGFSIFNDLTSRKIQKDHKQWFLGKSLDDYSILGPFIVTIDEFKFPIELDILSKVNGQIRQNSNTRYMIKTIEDIIVELSSHMTLEPGDIISTGTPSGVGMGFNPPKFLKSGDIVECSIEQIGVLKNRIK